MTPPIPYKTIIGSYVAPDGTPVGGTLRFIPSATVLDAADNVVIPPVPILVTLDGLGAFAVQLAVTDDPTTTPTGWTWRLDEQFAGGRQDVEFQIPTTAASTVSLADLVPASLIDETWQFATLASVTALEARVVAAESSAAVVIAAVVIHPFLTMGA